MEKELNEGAVEDLRKPRSLKLPERETFDSCVSRLVGALTAEGMNASTAKKVATTRCKSLKRDVEVEEGDLIVKADEALGSEAPHVGDRQTSLVHAYTRIVESFGLFDQGVGNEGCHYRFVGQNEFKEQGITCENCIFFRAPSSCDIVRGIIQPEGICKFWVIPEGAINPEAPGPRSSEEPAPAGDSLSQEEENQVASLEVEEDIDPNSLAAVLKEGELMAAGIKQDKKKEKYT